VLSSVSPIIFGSLLLLLLLLFCFGLNADGLSCCCCTSTPDLGLCGDETDDEENEDGDFNRTEQTLDCLVMKLRVKSGGECCLLLLLLLANTDGFDDALNSLDTIGEHGFEYIELGDALDESSEDEEGDGDDMTAGG
jgi:hypothetical protein